jgi:outer membrane protein
MGLLPAGGSAAQQEGERRLPPVAPGGEVPTVRPDQPISLQEAIQIAFQNYGGVQAAEESVEAAIQRVRQARAGTLPSVSAEVTYSGRGVSSLGGLFGQEPTQRVPGTTPGTTVRRSVNTDIITFDQGLQPRLAARWPIWDGGLTRASTRQARAGVESSVAGLGAVRNDRAFIVATNYLFQLRSERLLELRGVQETVALEQLNEVRARIREGAAAAADEALLLSEYQNRRVETITAQNDLRVSANALRNSMGLQVGPPLTLVELRENVEPLPPIEALREAAQRQRPEVIQAEAQVRIAQQSVSIARIGRKPRLDTLVTFDVTPSDAFQRSAFTFGAGVSFPIWDAGVTHAREEEARSGVEAAAAQLTQTRKDVAADVEDAYFTLVNARERVEASELAVRAAQVNLEATTARYRQGLGTIVDLVQAQEQFATASNNLVSALYDVHLAQAQLNRAVGRQ